MKNIVYFDLETQRSFNDVGGFANKEQMGVSVAVTFSTATGKYEIYPEKRMKDLIQCLCRADLVVGYNHLYFDYAVLQGYSVLNLLEQTVNLDMMVEIEKKIGFRLKLDSLVQASIGKTKTADGLQALKWWKEHQQSGSKEPLLKIAEYCVYDVKVTRDLHQYGVSNGMVKYLDRNGKPHLVEINW